MFKVALFIITPKCNQSILAYLSVHTMELVFSNRKEWTPDIFNNTDTSQKCYAKWKRPDTKGGMILFIWNSRKGKTVAVDQWFLRPGDGE